MGLRNALGVVLSVPFGIYPGTGALNVAFTDSGAPYRQRAKRMLAASALVGVAVCAGAICGQNHGLRLLVGTCWAFAAGMLVALDQTAADLGAISLVTLLVFSGFPMEVHKAAIAGVMAFCGGVIQTALSVASWPWTPHAPEERALAELFEALAENAGSAPATEAPPVTAQINHAQDVVQAERFQALLSQGERMRLGLLTLARLRARIDRESPGSPPVQTIDRFFAVATELLRCLAQGKSASALEMRDLVERMPIREARRQMDALAGQFRAALDLASRAAPAGAEQFERREAKQAWHLRLRGTLATLRANLSLQSAACRHAVRLAVCVAVGEAIAQSLGLRRSYWAPMTIAIVLKPDFSGTFSRGVLRLAGTFAGLAFSTALLHVMPPRTGIELALLAVSMFVVRAYGPANYGIAATAITTMVVLLTALSGIEPGSVIVPRALNTVIGGAVALVAYAVWPTWERTHLAETIARLLDAYREYFHQVRTAFERPDAPPPHALDRARVAGRRARTNLEASVERVAIEPGNSPGQMRCLNALLANSHRLVHAMMALEAGLSTSRSAPARAEFRTFAADVEMTLGRLAGALRGAPLGPDTLPDLREDHDALIAAGGSETERYALVNVETDRIVNSLNTLAGDVQRWIG
jgi:uncharacterized membrane protein YccC